MKTTDRKMSVPLLTATAAVVACVFLACASKQTPRDRITDPGELLFNGFTVSGIDCYSCHKGDGTGTWRGPNLGEKVPKLSDAAIEKAILEGPGMMPAYKEKVDSQQIAAITAWLRGRFH
jgi:mono/diheme cytochrome c family protein